MIQELERHVSMKYFFHTLVALLYQYKNATFLFSTPRTLAFNNFEAIIQTSDVCYTVDLWDFGGHANCSTMAKSIVAKSAAVIVVYDVHNRDSFESAKQWLHCCTDNPALLLANKIDMPNRQVSTSEGAALAAQFCVGYEEVSASTGANVKSSIESLIHAAISHSKFLQFTCVKSHMSLKMHCQQQQQNVPKRKPSCSGLLSLQCRGDDDE